MGCLGEDLLGLVFVSDSNHVTRVSRGKIQDRLPQANEDVLSLARDQFPADQLPGFFFCLRLNQERQHRAERTDRRMASCVPSSQRWARSSSTSAGTWPATSPASGAITARRTACWPSPARAAGSARPATRRRSSSSGRCWPRASSIWCRTAFRVRHPQDAPPVLPLRPRFAQRPLPRRPRVPDRVSAHEPGPARRRQNPFGRKFPQLKKSSPNHSRLWPAV